MAFRDMPIMQPQHDKAALREVRVYTVPWALFAGTEEWCQNFHGQSLEEIARRGGFSAQEALRVACNLTQDMYRVRDDDAHRILYSLVVMYRRGQRSIVDGTDTLPDHGKSAVHGS